MTGTSTLDSLNPEGKKRLQEFMDSGGKMLQDRDDLVDGVKDLAKRIAEELGVTTKVLMKALKSAIKNTIPEEKDVLATVEDILEITGHG